MIFSMFVGAGDLYRLDDVADGRDDETNVTIDDVTDNAANDMTDSEADDAADGVADDASDDAAEDATDRWCNRCGRRRNR